MAGVDLGKQYGPLPLGAWIVVVGGGLGIAWYSRRSDNVSAEPEIVEDISGVPGVGDGSVGGWVPTQPPAGGNPVQGKPTTNEEWAYAAKQHLIGKGYPATTVSSAIDKYLAGLKPSVQEWTLVGLALAAIGPLPTGLPVVVEPDPVKPTPTTPAVKKPTTAPTGLKASAVGSTWVRLDWNHVPHSVGYAVWEGGNPRTSPLYSSVVIPFLKPNTSYNFYVRARGIGSYVGPFAKVTVRTKK